MATKNTDASIPSPISWATYKADCARVEARLTALGLPGDDIWELADAAAETIERVMAAQGMTS